MHSPRPAQTDRNAPAPDWAAAKREKWGVLPFRKKGPCAMVVAIVRHRRRTRPTGSQFHQRTVYGVLTAASIRQCKRSERLNQVGPRACGTGFKPTVLMNQIVRQTRLLPLSCAARAEVAHRRVSAPLGSPSTQRSNRARVVASDRAACDAGRAASCTSTFARLPFLAPSIVTIGRNPSTSISNSANAGFGVGGDNAGRTHGPVGQRDRRLRCVPDEVIIVHDAAVAVETASATLIKAGSAGFLFLS